MWNSIISLFQDYMGTGLVMIWYLISLVYLLLREEDRTRRCLLVYTPLLVLLVFFNPLVMALMDRFGDAEIYYRILWLLPVSVTLAYTVIRVGEMAEGKLRLIFFGGVLAVALLTGKLYYTNGFVAPAENPSHVPDAVADICDEIVIPGREIMAAFPADLLAYVRQYTPFVCMPYGREQTVGQWRQWGVSQLYLLMESSEISGEELGAQARAEGCHYIILPDTTLVTGQVTDFEPYEEIDGYVLYRSLTANFTDYR